MTDPFSVPSGGGSGLEDLVGRLVVFTDITIRTDQPNPFNPGQTRDEADAVTVVLDGDGSRPKGGVFGTRLVRQCKARARFGFAYGRLTTVNVNGKNTLELTDPGPAATEQVKAWVGAHLPPYNGQAAPAPTAQPPAPAQAASSSQGAAQPPGTPWHPGTTAPPAQHAPASPVPAGPQWHADGDEPPF